MATTLENYADLLRRTGRDSEAAKMEARAKAIRAKHAAGDALNELRAKAESGDGAARLELADIEPWAEVSIKLQTRLETCLIQATRVAAHRAETVYMMEITRPCRSLNRGDGRRSRPSRTGG